MKSVAGKTAFITGGASGIGLGTAKVFAANGMNVIVADMRQDALDEAMAYFKEKKRSAHAIRLNVTDREAYARAADEAESVFGNVHILFNNAGVGVTGGDIRVNTFKDWDFGVSVNIMGVVNGILTILPRILKHGEEGHLISTSSTAGLFAVGGCAVYNATKYAVAGLMETIATDLADTNIGVSVLFPGGVRTNLGISTQANRPAELKNTDPPRVLPGAGNRPKLDMSLYMDPLEMGERVLRGILRNDLFINTHPEFKAGYAIRGEAVVRSCPDEPPNEPRTAVQRAIGTLLYNPIYEKQTTPGPLERTVKLD
jgi:NADP-dependent 3-hydroxy acid dehydrogenase YdfG